MRGIETMETSKKNLLITGLPGVGKTTLIKNLAEALHPHHPVGFYTAEIREGRTRKGFEWISLDGRRGLLSHTDIQTPYHVGKYKVDIEGFENLLGSLSFFNPSTRLIVIDEIGKMECLSNRFKTELQACLDSEKWVIATIALVGTRFVEAIKKRPDVHLFGITQKNRNSLLHDILREVEPLL
jgi:nucleoside-triphosphatase